MYLSCSEIELICGNFLGDFVRNKDLKDLPEGWIRGIQLHRKIDSFTDTHKRVKACTRLLHPSQGKYSPVIIDVVFDYILYTQWDKYSGVAFDDFEILIYDTLSENVDQFPERIKRRTLSMIDQKFFRSYTSLEGLRFTFQQMKNRLNFDSNIENAVDDLEVYQDIFTKEFNAFFPELIEVTNSYCHC
jgi:acyl carrier protein phosphodiesterase